MKMFITGDSHVGALRRALDRLIEAGSAPAGVEVHIRRLGTANLFDTPFFAEERDHIRLVEPKYRIHMKRLPPVDDDVPEVDAVGLSMPFWPMRVVNELAWDDMALPQSYVSDPTTIRPISTAMFRELVLADQRYVLELIEALRNRGWRVLAISCPGLFRDNKAMKQMKGRFVLAMFKAYQDIIKDELSRRNVPFICVPDACYDPKGFMLGEFRASRIGDSHHANEAFGELMMRQVLDWLVRQKNAAPALASAAAE